MQATTAQPPLSTRTASTENFPVAAWFLARDVRAQVMAFYRLARLADDCADDPTRSPAERLAALAETRTSTLFTNFNTLCVDIEARRAMEQLFQSFAADCSRSHPVPDWPALFALCQLSAEPVGRFLLVIHGETTGETAAQAQHSADALCTALQILNHIQDCRDDWVRLGRIFIPGILPHHLNAPRCSPDLRYVLNHALDQVDTLLLRAEPLPASIRNRRLRLQASLTLSLGKHLAQHLRQADPLQGATALPRYAVLRAVLAGFWRMARL